MGQRPSMQQSEVARRPRAGSELGSSAQTTGSSSATAHIHNHRRANGTRSRQPQNDTSSPSSASSASPASAHSSRSFTEEAAEGVSGGGAAELARFFNQLGFVPVQSSSSRHRTSAEILIGGTSTSPSGSGGLAQPQQQTGDAASSAPSTSGRHASSSSSNLQHRRSAGGGDSHNTHHHQRHRRLGATASGANAATSAAHQRVSRNHQRSGDNTSDRLQALLHSLEAMANASGDAGALSSSSASVQLTAVQLNKLRRTAPLLQLLGRDFKCPVCQKVVPSDDVEMHLVMCLTRPQLSYNDDVLTMDKGECAICLEEMEQGAHIARLPCLCIYHKGCIDEWFKRKNTCPEHPGNED
ncbi:hypothetical protein niasHT_024543 [Heterodera trifolii]|uniref:E3 ubiquitin-protein ligase ZNRF1 n=1 Tax=Heterodera trifolii TaxID=157864 RepID=A0ABD2K7B7_9BILA